MPPIDTNCITVGVVEPSALMREGLASLVNSEVGFRCAGTWTEHCHALDEIDSLRPSVLVLTLQPSNATDFRVIDRIMALSPETRPVILIDCESTPCPILDQEIHFEHREREQCRCESRQCGDLAARLGSTPILRKQTSFAELLNKIGDAANKTHALNGPPVSNGSESANTRSASLSPRENEIVALVARGHSNPQIADSLGLSYSTVKNYISSVLNKWNLEHRTQIAIYALSRNDSNGHK